MRLHVVAAMVTNLSLSFMPGAEAARCPVRTTSINITSTAELQSLISTMNCTGEGTFDVTWVGSLRLQKRIEVSDKKTLIVTGSSPPLTDVSTAVIDAGNATGMFGVANGSTLILNDVVLEGGNADTGAAIDARSFSVVRVAGCVFVNNNATNGGAIFSDNADIHIDGDTIFVDNSAQEFGGAVYASGSDVFIAGQTYFFNNSGGVTGGGLFVINSSTFINGDTVFVNNNAAIQAGAIYARDSDVHINGNTTFVNNLAGDEGGAVAVVAANIFISGNTSFAYNSAVGGAGAIKIDSSNVTVDGRSSFSKNLSAWVGGAIVVVSSVINLSGESYFGYNSAALSGGAIITGESEVYTNGSISFVHNSAGTEGGAIFSRASTVRMTGQIWFGYNSAQSAGGAVYAHYLTPFYMEGNTTFTHNTAGEDGGALSVYSKVEVGIVGVAVFSHNEAIWRGGAISLVIADLRVNGNTSFVHNKGYDGGAIVAHQSSMLIDGNASFVNNTADHDGGTINVVSSNVTIVGEVELSSNTALNGGGIFSSSCPTFNVLGQISFWGNHAEFYGGAISLTDPIEIYVLGASFENNTGTSGGAVSLTSTEVTTGGFEQCRFDGNDASNGGALYLSIGETGEPQEPRFVQDSVFLRNSAVELGGAIFNAGAWEINDTVFADNTAGGGGLAIHDEGSFLVLWNDTFRDNMFSCPAHQYSDAHHDTGVTCRLELACQQCSVGCEASLEIANVQGDTIPSCEDIPDGVSQQSTTTLETFDLLEGYYRVSAESRVIRECYQPEACSGGTDHLNYCATGYTGPYCAVCADGYAPGVMSLCHECSTEHKRWTVGLVAAAMVFLVFVTVSGVFYIVREAQGEAEAACPQTIQSCYKRLAGGLPLSAIKTVVVVLQIVTQFTEIAGAVYPDQYEEFISKMTAINLDIGFILSNSCIVTTDFYDRILIATVGPLVVLLVLFGTIFIAARRGRGRSTSTGSAEPILQNKRASTGLFIIFFVYSSVSFTIFQTFVCDDLDDGMSYLRADYSILCSTERYTAYKAYASVMVCVYPVGIPAFFAWWLARNRQELKESGRDEIAHLESFRGLWGAYSPSCYYYEVVECSRRIALTGAAVFVLPNSADQIAVLFLVAVAFTFISETFSPFDTKADMWLYRWGNAVILASMYVALLFKVELADNESQSSAVMTTLLIAGNVFMIAMVFVQAFVLAKGMYTSTPEEEVYPDPSRSSRLFSASQRQGLGGWVR